MTPLRKSGKTYRIDKYGYQAANPGSSKPKAERCPIIGDPLKWLEEYNKQFKTEE
jgi:hypothetical protein